MIQVSRDVTIGTPHGHFVRRIFANRPPCPHDRGFREVHVVDPQPGVAPQVTKATCLGCGETRYMDPEGDIYRTPADAWKRENPERRMGE